MTKPSTTSTQQQATSSQRVANKPVVSNTQRLANQKADDALAEVIEDIGKAIIDVAGMLAKRDDADTIQSAHIKQARKLLSPKRSENRLQEFAKFVGSALFGAFIPGFVTSMQFGQSGPNVQPVDTTAVTLYVLLGVAGALIFSFGAWNKE